MIFLSVCVCVFVHCKIFVLFYSVVLAIICLKRKLWVRVLKYIILAVSLMKKFHISVYILVFLLLLLVVSTMYSVVWLPESGHEIQMCFWLLENLILTVEYSQSLSAFLGDEEARFLNGLILNLENKIVTY